MSNLLETYRPAGHARSHPPLAMLDRASHRLRRWLTGKPGTAADYRRRAEWIRAASCQLQGLSDGELRLLLAARAKALRRTKARMDGGIDGFLAGLVVAAKRVHGFEPHVEQMMGTLALDGGWLAEMATGEGKTLVAGFGAILLAAQGRRCHVLTANDYLAARDRDLLEKLAAWCGIEVGCVTGETKPPLRAEGYAKPIVYSTAKDVLADFLRDRLGAGAAESSVLRLARALAADEVTSGTRTLPPLDTVIVDEADHVLIDEAVTPLIISQKVANPALAQAVKAADHLVAGLLEGTDFIVDRQHREIRMLESGRAKVAGCRDRFPDGWSSAARRAELLDTALQARAFFLRDHHYVIADGKVVIVDESTGRMMPDRQWQQGLHQAVEVKEGLEPGDPTVIAARMSFQRFFRLYRQLAGLTGTAWEARHELDEIYGLKVLRVPTHRPCVRVHEPDEIVTAHEKWQAICAHIESMHRTKRPVLAGTRTVADSERLRRMLQERGHAVEVLNAINHEREAEIVASAGEFGRIMIATNMAGRGTDISLAPGVAAMGGLHVLAAERHASRRIDRQMFGRAGRQGDPGSARAFASLDDDVVVRNAPRWARRGVRWIERMAPVLSRPLSVLLIGVSQRIAGKRDASRRRHLLAADYRLEESLGVPPEVS
ncbi:MAG: hypothetical protein NTW21_13920 [Verrucomicrobia bacterium]|nr:hypothetical protein [Verrucomicrobiota bacterium]